jgi:hypothetical protein
VHEQGDVFYAIEDSCQGKRTHIAEDSCQCSSCPSKKGQLPVKDREALYAAEDSCLCKKVQLSWPQRTAVGE